MTNLKTEPFDFSEVISNLSHLELPAGARGADCKDLITFYRALGKELDAFLSPVETLPARSGVSLPKLLLFSDYLEEFVIPEIQYTLNSL